MSKFEQYLKAVKKESNSNITISDVEATNIKKLKDDTFFKSSFGFKKEPWEKVGNWIWPKEAKVRWFNADYNKNDSINFQAEYWLPVLDDDQRKEYGVLQFWKYEKPTKAVGRKAGDIKGKNVSWLYKLGEEKIQQLAGNKEKIVQLNYKTASVTDAVQTFYGSSQDLLKLLS